MQRFLLPTIILLYLASRLWGAVAFEPHTDEMIYTQFAQKIAEDWNANKYISIDGSMYQDYKEPLQYWLTSLTVNRFTNPLLGTRMWSILFGLLGFICTYLLTKKLFGRTTALLTAAFILTSGYYLYFDSIALAEVYVYGMGTAFLLALYDGMERSKISSIVIASFLLGLILISKASGMIWIALALLVPFLHQAKNVKHVTNNFLKVLTTIIIASSLYALIIPNTFRAIATASHARRVRSLEELFDFPLDTWLGNLQRGFHEALWTELGWMIFPLIACIALVLYQSRKKDRTTFRILVVILAMFVVTLVTPAVMLQSPYVRFYGMGLLFFYIASAASIVILSTRLTQHSRYALHTILVLFLLLRALTLAQSLTLYRFTDTALAEARGGWAVGLGITEMVEHLSDLPPGVLVYDPQWGHPGTAIQVFADRYPQLELAPGLEPIIAKLNEIKTEADKLDKNLYLVFDARIEGERPIVDQLLMNNTYCNTKETITKEYRGEVLEDTSIVICTTE